MNQISRHRLDGLQALRFFAALAVVVMHASQAAIARTGASSSGFDRGSFGVDVFFVLSGFVMALTTPSSASAWSDRLQQGRDFFVRRIVRVVPIYWFYSFLKIGLVLAAPALAYRTTLGIDHIAASFFFVPFLSPWGAMEPILPVGWTLNFEMFFYCLFTIAIACALPRILFCVLVFLAIRILAHFQPDDLIIKFYAQSIIFEFVLGMLAAKIWLKFKDLPTFAGVLMTIPAASIILYLPRLPINDRMIAWGLPAFGLVLGVALLEPHLRNFQITKFFKTLGDASYSLYLSHAFTVPLVMAFTYKILGAGWAATFAVAVSIPIAQLSYLLIEKPLLKSAKRPRPNDNGQ